MNNVAHRYCFRSAFCILGVVALLALVSTGLLPAGTVRTGDAESSRAALIAIQDCHPPAAAAAGDSVRMAGRVSGSLKWFAGIGSLNRDPSFICDFLAIPRYRASLESTFLRLKSGRSPPGPFSL